MNNNYQHEQQNNQEQTKPESSGLMKMVGQSLPFLPLLFEQFTGQKVPQITGTMAEIQMALSQVIANQQVIVNNQQQFSQRLTNLENNATNQFTNLVQQVQSIKSIRLSHSKETKAIDYNVNQENQIN
jgi:hypothetical protein